MKNRLYELLADALGDKHEAMVPVQALYDIAGEDWLIAANEAALTLNAKVDRPQQASAFARIARRPPLAPRPG